MFEAAKTKNIQAFPAKTGSGGPDFRHVETWVFDLDNTLYPAHADLFGQIEERMNRFVQETFRVGPEEANRLRKTYFRDHGTTLSGLMKVHGMDPEPFLEFVHDIDLSVLDPSPALSEALGKLPGKRFVFTNGCRNHAARVMERLGIAGRFDDVWDIRTLGFIPKPAEAAYDKILETGKFAPQSAAMFEDIKRNLVPAHDRGFTTVWLKNTLTEGGPLTPKVESHHIHHETDNLAAFLSSLITKESTP